MEVGCRARPALVPKSCCRGRVAQKLERRAVICVCIRPTACPPAKQGRHSWTSARRCSRWRRRPARWASPSRTYAGRSSRTAATCRCVAAAAAAAQIASSFSEITRLLSRCCTGPNQYMCGRRCQLVNPRCSASPALNSNILLPVLTCVTPPPAGCHSSGVRAARARGAGARFRSSRRSARGSATTVARLSGTSLLLLCTVVADTGILGNIVSSNGRVYVKCRSRHRLHRSVAGSAFTLLCM